MKKIIFLLTVLLSLMFVFVSCQQNITPLMENSNISGNAIFSDKSTHGDILITVEGIENGYSPIDTVLQLGDSLTDNEGKFTVESIPSGIYIVKASYDGYFPTKTFAEIKNSDIILSEDLILYPAGDSGQLEGYAKYIDRSINSSILIEIKTKDGDPLPGMYTFTDRKGYYYFDMVPVGEYVVYASDRSENSSYSGDAAPVVINKNVKTKANDLILRKASEHIIVFKDSSAWTQPNAITDVLNGMGFTEGTGKNQYEVKGSDYMISAASFDPLWVLIIEGDQTTAFYDTYKNNHQKFDTFVQSGGTIFWIACDKGWNGGDFTGTLPGGVTWRDNFDNYNYVTNPTHPLLYGFPYDRAIYGNYASHGGFDNLGNAGIENLVTFIRENTTTELYPTYIEYRYGNGRVIASASPLEYYVGNGGGDSYWYVLLMKRSIEYAFNMALSPAVNPQ